MIHKIKIVRAEITREWTIHFEIFKFCHDRPFHKLQRICLWVLRKLKCFHQTVKCEYEEYEFDTHDFAVALLKQREFFGRRDIDFPEIVYIGRQQFNDLRRQPSSMTPGAYPLGFEATFNGGKNGLPCIFGMKIVVVPWLDGILIPPKVSFPSPRDNYENSR